MRVLSTHSILSFISQICDSFAPYVSLVLVVGIWPITKANKSG